MTRLFVVVAAAMCLTSAAARAQQPPSAPAVDTSLTIGTDTLLEARTSSVASQLRCPVCQGLSIQDSPSDLARSMRSLVREQLAEGKSPDQVKAYFVSKYGEWILLAPSAHGFNLLAYAAPLLLVLGGAAGIGVAIRRWTLQARE